MTASDDDIDRMAQGNEATPCRRAARDWMIRLGGGSVTVADLDEFKRWAAEDPAHAVAFARIRKVWDESRTAGRRVAAFGEVPAVRSGPTAAAFQPQRRALIGGALAASAAAYIAVRPPLGLWTSLPELMRADYRTSTGEQRTIALGSGVSIEMNTHTSIAMEGDRQIELLAGEGAIVTGAQDFSVIAGNGRVWSSNSTFCIRREDHRVRVTCVEGEVGVVSSDQAVRLAARQQVSYSEVGLDRIIAVEPDTVTAWRTGQLVFEGIPLSDVIAEANRYRRGRIVVINAALGRQLVNVRVRIDHIDDLVPKLINAFGATATTLPGGVVILS